MAIAIATTKIGIYTTHHSDLTILSFSVSQHPQPFSLLSILHHFFTSSLLSHQIIQLK